jgi:hypothetical protein
MSCSLGAIESHVGKSASKMKETAAYRKAQALMLRSTVAAVADIVKGLANFAHPYLPKIIAAALSLHTVRVPTSSNQALHDEADRALSSVLKDIPARLSVPSLLSCAPQILASSAVIAAKFALFLKEFWNDLDRNTLVAHLSDLFSVGVLCLDYRRVYGKDIDDNDRHPDHAIVDAVSQLCLKLTESELRTHMLKLLDWKNINADGSSSEVVPGFEGKCRFSRGVTFYRFVVSLADKLKSLMSPSMSLVWPDAAEVLLSFPQIVAAAGKAKHVTTQEPEVSLRGRKKQKASSLIDRAGEVEEPDVNKRKCATSNNSFDEDGSLHELKEQVVAVLRGVRAVSANDNSNFVDQVRIFIEL